MKKSKRNVYKEITEKIVNALKEGIGPWIRPYEGSGPHRNAYSGRPYRGINILLLEIEAWKRGFASPLWLTYREAQKLGGYVKRGEKATSVIFWKIIEVEEKDQNGNPVIDPKTGRPVVQKIPFARLYYVFNVEQCELSNFQPPESPQPEGLLAKLYALPEVKLQAGTIPAYYPLKDIIVMPPIKDFKSPDDFWATFLHELTHWTGHESRLNRQLENRFGDQAYAMEEMVAEIGAAFLGAFVGLPIERLQHPEYISNWIRVLENDSKAVFTASRFAQEACDWLLERVSVEAEEPECEMKEAA